MTIATLSNSGVQGCSLRVGREVDADAFQSIRRRMMLEFCKWDTQVGDVSTLANFPLILSRSQWQELATSAELLASETMELERRLLGRPDLYKRIGLPSRLRRVLRDVTEDSITPSACRVMRFDFHPTADGWRVSEVNSDVPGGFCEASAFTKMIATQTDGASVAGDPQSAYIEALAHAADTSGGPVVLLAAAGFMEDQQIIAGLAARLRRRNVDAILAEPRQLEWVDGRAFLRSAVYIGLVGAIVRFYQGEWFASLPRSVRWQPLFIGGKTPVANPGCAILSESKRFPLVWDELGAECPTWKSLLPETRDPRGVPWSRDESWLLKSAYCNTGDSVTIRSAMLARAWHLRRLDVLLNPNQWIAQWRFETQAIDTPMGEMFPCIGVYTIDGYACGIYGRISAQPVINYSAMDVAVLVEDQFDERIER